MSTYEALFPLLNSQENPKVCWNKELSSQAARFLIEMRPEEGNASPFRKDAWDVKADVNFEIL